MPSLAQEALTMWTHSESTKTLFGYQSKKILEALVKALGEDPDQDSLFKNKPRLTSAQFLLRDEYNSKMCSARDFIIDTIRIYYEALDDYLPQFNIFYDECDILRKEVPAHMRDASSVSLMLKRSRMAA